LNPNFKNTEKVTPDTSDVDLMDFETQVGIGLFRDSRKVTPDDTAFKARSAVVHTYYERKSARYPNGVMVVFSGTNVLYKGELPVGEIPIIEIKELNEPNRFVPLSFVENLMSPQFAYNLARSQELEYVKQAIIGAWIMKENSVDTPPTGSAGEHISYRGDKEPRRAQGEQLPGAVFSIAEQDKQDLEELGMLQASSRGIGTTTVTSGLHARLLIEADDCVDTETELLTKSGWRKWNEFSIGDEIYTFNVKTSKAEWKSVKGIYRKHRTNRDMIRMKNQRFDALVTPDHKWPARKDNGKKVSLIETTNLTRHVIPRASEISSWPESFYGNDFVELVGWYITEGSIKKNYRGSKYGIVICQSELSNADKCERIRQLLTRLEVKFTERKKKDGCIQFAFHGEVVERLRAVAPSKALTLDFVYTLSKFEADTLMESMVLADGHYYNDAKHKHRGMFCNTTKETIDSFTVLLSLLGVSYVQTERIYPNGIWKKLYNIYFGSTTNIHTRKIEFTPAKYTGTIWCPHTENGTFFARRNGKTYFTGNTKLGPYSDMIEMATQEVGNLILRYMRVFFVGDRILRIVGDNRDVQVIAFKGADLRADVEVVTGSSLSQSRVLRQEEIYLKWQAGFYGDPAGDDSRRHAAKLMDEGYSTPQSTTVEANILQAKRENLQAQNGDQIDEPMPWQDHKLHNVTHIEWLVTDGVKAGPEAQMAMWAHVQAENKMFIEAQNPALMGASPQPSPPAPPAPGMPGGVAPDQSGGLGIGPNDSLIDVAPPGYFQDDRMAMPNVVQPTGENFVPEA